MNRCVVVVEDEPLIRMQTVDMLEAAGLRVADYDNAGDVLAHLASTDPVAAVFTDINLLGRVSGIDLACQVAREHPEVTILVTSGRYARRPDGLPPQAAYLPKPWLPLQVLKAMQDAAA